MYMFILYWIDMINGKFYITPVCADQSSASLAFVWGIHRGPVNSLHKWPLTRKMFPFDDVIMILHFLPLPNTWDGTRSLDDRVPFIHNQYHGCWWPGDGRSQNISSRGTDPSLSMLVSVPKCQLTPVCSQLSVYYTLYHVFMQNGKL